MKSTVKPQDYESNAEPFTIEVHRLALELACAHFPQGASLLDVGCATAPLARRLWETGDYGQVTLVESELPLLLEAKRKMPHARAVWSDARLYPTPHADCALLTNVTGYFTPGELAAFLANIRADLLIANFLVAEDQPDDDYYVTEDGYSRPLLPCPWASLHEILFNNGLKQVETRRYDDGKPERLMVLSR